MLVHPCAMHLKGQNCVGEEIKFFFVALLTGCWEAQ
jgi:hypothetical protein